MRKLLRRGSVASLVLCAACSGRETKSTSDASVSSVDPLATLHRFEPFASAGRGVRLERDPRGLFVASGARWGAAAPLSAFVPMRSDGSTHLERAGVSLDIARKVDASIEGRVHEGSVLFESVAAATDLVHVASPGAVEEITILRDAHAPTSFRWTLHLGGEATSARLHEGRVAILGEGGHPRIESEPMFAVDANGVRRDLAVSLQGEGKTWVLTATLDTKGLAYPIAVDPKWATSVGALSYAHNFAPTLRDPVSGKVYVVGGNSAGGSTGGDAVEVYDPATDTWSSGGKLTVPRQQHVATMLGDGRILVAGGYNSISTAEVYDPATKTSTATSPLTTGRHDAVSARLPDGRVLVTSGASSTSNALQSTEIWDPGLGTWTPGAPLVTGRTAATMVTLASGKPVVLAGGVWGSTAVITTAETYDPSTNTWSSQALAFGVRWPVAILSADRNKILLTGGQTPSDTAAVQYFDGTSWATKTSMSRTRYQHGGALLPDGRFLVAGGALGGGYIDTSAEIYDVATNTWTAAPAMANGHYNFHMVSIPGRVLAVSGQTGVGAKLSELFTPDPITCALPTDCASGNCVDGYCCDQPCTGQCQACDSTGNQGICTAISGPPHGTRTSCGTYTCDPSVGTTGACATSCLLTSACASGNWCSAGSCVPKKSNGSTCTAAEQCTSGNCVDGTCCSTSCTGGCVACDVSGSLGTCVNVTSGSPHASHTCSGYACSGGSCLTTCSTDADCDSKSWCSGTTCIARRSNGTGCSAGTECSSGNCVDGVCCDTSCTGPCSACDVSGKVGTCSAVTSGAPHGTRTCSPGLTCGATGCVLTCTSDTQCASGSACIGGTCQGKKASGIACAANSECTSGQCQDGVCCNVACTGACQACNLAGTLGTCTGVDGAADPHGKCPVGACADVCKAGACGFATAVTACGTPSCAGSTITTPHCSGTDATCVAGAPASCGGGLTCFDAKNCRVSCTSGADCVSGVCDPTSGLCLSSADAGTDATSDTSADTSMADTLVADTAVDDTFVPDSAVDATTDDTRPIAMTPAPKLEDQPKVAGEFQRCAKDSECSTGHCVEGVCCDTACTDRCHSCALLTSPGKCTLEPVGVDLKSECGPALQCLGTCGPGGECIGSGNGTMCERNHCTGPTTGAGPAYCPGPGGKCPTDAVVPFDCLPYICEPAFGACRTNCVSSSDCAHDFVCDVASKTCVAAPTPAADTGDSGGGGCVISDRPGGAKSGVLAFGALAALGLLRRRIRRSVRS